jgi:nucleoside diphosphate kinase
MTSVSSARPRRRSSADRLTSIGHSLDLEALTEKLFPDPQARFFIGRDLNFLDGLSTAADRMAHVPAEQRAAALVNFAWDHTLVVLQPDTFARRLAPNVLDIIRDSGFEPVSSRIIQPNETTVGELWRYQAHRTEFKVRDNIIYPYMTDYPSLALVVRDVSGNGEQNLPAAARFMEAKGRTFVAKDDTTSIRARLGVTNALFCLLHSCDGPGEFFRESHLMRDPRNPGAFLVPDADIDRRLQNQIASINSRIPENSLQFRPALQRIANLVEDVKVPTYGGERADAKQEMLDILKDIGQQVDVSTRSDATTRIELWDRFVGGVEYMAALGIAPDFDEFDLLIIGSEVADYFRPDEGPHIVEPWRAEWKDVERPALDGAMIA